MDIAGVDSSGKERVMSHADRRRLFETLQPPPPPPVAGGVAQHDRETRVRVGWSVLASS